MTEDGLATETGLNIRILRRIGGSFTRLTKINLSTKRIFQTNITLYRKVNAVDLYLGKLIKPRTMFKYLNAHLEEVNRHKVLKKYYLLLMTIQKNLSFLNIL